MGVLSSRVAEEGETLQAAQCSNSDTASSATSHTVGHALQLGDTAWIPHLWESKQTRRG
jgi:hypothetical protein